MKLGELTFPEYPDKEYEQTLQLMQQRFMACQQGLFQRKRRAIVVFEGTDAAGKGGAIKRMVLRADPRGYRVYPISAPTPDEAARHYLQRFWRRIPMKGQLAIFDRSWYGRVLVERVEGITPKKLWKRAYRELRDFERLLTDDGIVLIKLFLHISENEQRNRFIERLENPHKQWKITTADLESRKYWDQYQQAYQDMLDKTSTKNARWKVIPANDKKFARIEVLGHVVEELEAIVDPDSVDMLSPEVKKLAGELFNKH